MTDETEQQKHNLALQSATAGGTDMLLDRPRFEQAYKIARLFSQSFLVPEHLRGHPEDCFIALHMADRLGEDPLMVMQNIVVVNGTAGWKAQWLIGRANRSGVFRGRIRFEVTGSGDSLRVDAKAVLADTGDEVSAYADLPMAKAEGWTKNPKYQSMPQQMLSYRAASFLIRLYCPEATLGYQSAEEVEDVAAAQGARDVTPTHTAGGQGSGAVSALRDLPGDPAPEVPETSDNADDTGDDDGDDDPDPTPPAGGGGSGTASQSSGTGTASKTSAKKTASKKRASRARTTAHNSRSENPGEDTGSDGGGDAAPVSGDAASGSDNPDPNAPTDDELFGECTNGVDDVIARGDADEIDRRLDAARSISDESLRHQCMKVLEDSRDRIEANGS